MDKKLIEILENVILWDTCPDDYKLEIERQLKRQKNKSTLAERKQLFTNSVLKYPEYGEIMLDEFLDYWSEHNDNGYKMKFEMQKTWNTKLRLKQWHKRSRTSATKSNGVNQAWQ